MPEQPPQHSPRPATRIHPPSALGAAVRLPGPDVPTRIGTSASKLRVTPPLRGRTDIALVPGAAGVHVYGVDGRGGFDELGRILTVARAASVVEALAELGYVLADAASSRGEAC